MTWLPCRYALCRAPGGERRRGVCPPQPRPTRTLVVTIFVVTAHCSEPATRRTVQRDFPAREPSGMDPSTPDLKFGLPYTPAAAPPPQHDGATFQPRTQAPNSTFRPSGGPPPRRPSLAPHPGAAGGCPRAVAYHLGPSTSQRTRRQGRLDGAADADFGSDGHIAYKLQMRNVAHLLLIHGDPPRGHRNRAVLTYRHTRTPLASTVKPGLI